MSIQMLAQELYRLLQEVEKIENQLENAPLEKKEEIKDKLRKISAERNRIRAAIDVRIDRQSNNHISYGFRCQVSGMMNRGAGT